MVEIRTDTILPLEAELSLRVLLGETETNRLIHAIKNQKWIIMKGISNDKRSKVLTILRDISYPFLIDSSDVTDIYIYNA